MMIAENLRDVFTDLGLKAGALSLFMRKQGLKIHLKADATPVSDADLACEALIVQGLSVLEPKTPVLAEESGASSVDLGPRFFVIDPLDGTHDYIKGGKDFTVNIALVIEGSPVAGLIIAPAWGRLYYGDPSGAWVAPVDAHGACLLEVPVPIMVRPRHATTPVAVVSRARCSLQTQGFMAQIGAEAMPLGSSLKFCYVAEGRADFHPRFEPVMEWDTAAGDAILRAAGGKTLDLSGKPVRYGQRARGFIVPPFIAQGGDKRKNGAAGEI